MRIGNRESKIAFLFFINEINILFLKVHADGTVCISILHSPTDSLNEQESAEEKYSLNFSLLLLRKYAFFYFKNILKVETCFGS